MQGSPTATDANVTGDAGPRFGGDEQSGTERSSRASFSCRELVHDLSNSLSGIAMLADHLIETTRSNPEAAEELEMVRSTAREGVASCHRLRELLAEAVQDIRRESRASRPEGDQLSESVDVNCVVRQTAPLLRRIAGADVEMRFEAEPGLPSIISTKAELRHLLINLVLNASQALRSVERRITIRTGRVDGARVPRGPEVIFAGRLLNQPYVCVSVVDAGIGLSPEVRERIFKQRFTTKPDGHGDGLLSVHKTAEACGGAVAIDGSPGGDTMVRVFLPPASRNMK